MLRADIPGVVFTSLGLKLGLYGFGNACDRHGLGAVGSAKSGRSEEELN